MTYSNAELLEQSWFGPDSCQSTQKPAISHSALGMNHIRHSFRGRAAKTITLNNVIAFDPINVELWVLKYLGDSTCARRGKLWDQWITDQGSVTDINSLIYEILYQSGP